MMKRILLLCMALCLVMISCPNQTNETSKKIIPGPNENEGEEEGEEEGEDPKELLIFDVAPALQLASVNGGFAYSWQDSDPPSESVDLHWIISQAPVDNVNLIWEFGYVRRDVQLLDNIAVLLADDEYFSAYITARKDGYAAAYSNIVVKEAEDLITDFTFDYAPELTVTSGAGSLTCTWTSAYPFPGRYDLYYAPENFTSAARVKADGVKIQNCTSPYTIESLEPGKAYSVVVTAERAGYVGIDSVVRANQQPR